MTKKPFTAIYVHVDDLAITGSDISHFKDHISKKWEMEDPGLAKMVVGIQITRPNSTSYTLSQSKFAESILSRFNMTEIKPAATPLLPGLKLRRATDLEIEDSKGHVFPYQNAVGSLIYLAQCTRPDLAHAVGVLPQHLGRPIQRHWDAVVHVFRYLCGRVNLGITYSALKTLTMTGLKSFDCPVSHCHSDGAGDRDTRRSTTGYFFTLAGGAVTWKSRLQPTVALSSTEAESGAVTEAGQELLWLCNMMERFGLKDENPTTLESNNMGGIHLTSKSIFHGRTKHVEIQYHWVRKVVSQGSIKLKHCLTQDMMHDVLTKSLGKAQFQRLRLKMGLSVCEPSS